MSLFNNSIVEGNAGGNTALLYAYGVYLAGGGRPDDFLDMRPDDVQIMLSVHSGERERLIASLIKSLGMMFGAEEK